MFGWVLNLRICVRSLLPGNFHFGGVIAAEVFEVTLAISGGPLLYQLAGDAHVLYIDPVPWVLAVSIIYHQWGPMVPPLAMDGGITM